MPFNANNSINSEGASHDLKLLNSKTNTFSYPEYGHAQPVVVQDAKKHMDNGSNSKMDWFKAQVRKSCSPQALKKTVLKRIPILSWAPTYNVETGVADFIAGLTVGLTVIPQGIAYALVANLDPQYGLYSAFMGCFAYLFLGSCKDITVGPTAIMALLTSHYVTKGPEFAVLLTFLTGLIITAFGILKLGFVIDFISVPVTAGFCSAAAITIASSQIKALFGLEITHKNHDEGIIGTWQEVVENFETVRAADATMGLICVVALLLMRELKNAKAWFEMPDEDATCCQNLCHRVSGGNSTVKGVLNKTIWVISTARNAIIVVICSLIAYICDGKVYDKEHQRDATFILTGNIESGLPPFQLPSFSYNDTSTDPSGVILNFSEMVSELSTAVIIIPLLAILENVAIAKAFAGGKPVDASQEMIALGVCNFLGSFVSSMPTTGSFSRTAVNCASGVRTPAGGVVTGALVILALGLLMPLCAYIPKASLAAVIITAVIFSVEYEVIRPMWRSKKIDLIPAFATFFTCLFWALEWGIMIGVGIQILIILYHAARPKVNVEHRILNGIQNSNYIYVTLDSSIIFPSVAFVRHQINKAGMVQGESRFPLVLDLSHVSTSDFTAAKGFKAMISDFRKRNQPIIFYNTSASVIDTFLGVNIEQFVVVNSNEELLSHLRNLFEPMEENGTQNGTDFVVNPSNGAEQA